MRRDVEVEIRTGLADDLREAPSGADGDGGFGHDHCVARKRPRHLFGGGIDEAEIGMAIAASGATKANQPESRPGNEPGPSLLPGRCFQQPATHLPLPSNSMVRSLIAR
jgi:hypothetical protein